MPIVTFVRHGESAANAGLETKTFADIELTERGIRQATELAASWEAAPDLIVTSPFLRARQSAQPTIDRFPDVSVEEWPVQEFMNLRASRWNGTRAVDREIAMTAYWQKLDANYCDDGEGECFAAFCRRAEAALERLEQLSAQTVLVFSHGHFIHAVRAALQYPELDAQARMDRFLEDWATAPIRNCQKVQLEIGAGFAGDVRRQR